MKKFMAIFPFILLVIATYLTFSNSWIVPEINKWQAKIIGGNKFFPALTIFIIVLPPLLVLVFLKLWLQKKPGN